jgi:high-affinity Fe2+/Pb2+ permease
VILSAIGLVVCAGVAAAGVYWLITNLRIKNEDKNATVSKKEQ